MKRWTKDEEEFVRVCCKGGWTHREIGNELDRSYRSIKQKAMHLKVSNDKFTKIKSHSQYVQELKEQCPTLRCLEEYKGTKIKIKHECLKCGSIYKSNPRDKLRGFACKYCGNDNNSGGIPLNKQGITYLVYIPKYDLYKIGITSKSTKERMSDNNIYTYDLILEHTFVTGVDAISLESQWKDNLKAYLINTGLLSTGNTETFRI